MIFKIFVTSGLFGADWGEHSDSWFIFDNGCTNALPFNTAVLNSSEVTTLSSNFSNFGSAFNTVNRYLIN